VAPDLAAGKADYGSYCASCHGPEGAGDGALAATLNPKPARHSDGAYMNSLSDEHLFKVIKFGGAAAGKSPMMVPMNGMLSDQQIRNLVAFVRSLADPPYEP
jgi:mono/diheme cytochrome c family protein